MIFLGVVATILFILSFVGQFSFYIKGKRDDARAAGVESAIWFVAMVTCFK